MKTESNHSSLEALKNLIAEAFLIVSTTEPMPENRTPRCCELLKTALLLADDLSKQGAASPAAALGHKGGTSTARRHGSEHYRQMAAARKTLGGGRPRKKTESPA